MTSYEQLADAAFAAAIDLKKSEDGKVDGYNHFKAFAKLLREPISPDQTYKLLYDARNLPIYRAAWSEAFPSQATDTKSDALLKRISDALEQVEKNIESKKQFDVKPWSRFCLQLNKLFLEENGKQFYEQFRARVANAPT